MPAETVIQPSNGQATVPSVFTETEPRSLCPASRHRLGVRAGSTSSQCRPGTPTNATRPGASAETSDVRVPGLSASAVAAGTAPHNAAATSRNSAHLTVGPHTEKGARASEMTPSDGGAHVRKRGQPSTGRPLLTSPRGCPNRMG